jgi:hypothetical protein
MVSGTMRLVSFVMGRRVDSTVCTFLLVKMGLGLVLLREGVARMICL